MNLGSCVLCTNNPEVEVTKECPYTITVLLKVMSLYLVNRDLGDSWRGPKNLVPFIQVSLPLSWQLYDVV